MRSYLLVIKTVLESDCTPNNFRATLGEKPGDDKAALAFHPLQMPKIHMFGVLQKTGRTQRTKKLVESHRLQALSACTALEKCVRPDSCLQLRRVTSQTGVVRKPHAKRKTYKLRLQSTSKMDGLTAWAITLSSTPPHHSRRCYFVQQRPLLFNLALLGGNRPNQDPEDCFGYDVSDRIADLLAGCRRHAGDPDHLDDVHEGIGQPRDDREPASVPRERPHRWNHVASCFFQSDSQLRHNIEERNHGKEPPHPPAAWAVLDLTRVPESHHHRGGHTRRPALAHRFLGW